MTDDILSAGGIGRNLIAGLGLDCSFAFVLGAFSCH